MNDYLQQAYMATTYVVSTEDKKFNLKININNLEFNKWCTKKKIDSWAIITAFNPFSKELNDAENNALNAQLKAYIKKNNFSFYEAQGVPSDSNWSAEESYFICNISLKKAQEIGIYFEQNAIVYGEKSSTAKLIWLV